MNRIYQGRVTRVEKLKPGANGKSNEDWQPLDNWEDTLWQHHVLFQDAVNYYVIALAAMAAGAEDESFQKEWIDAAIQQVDGSNKSNQRKKSASEKKLEAQAQLRALVNWRQKVVDTWEKASRKAEVFDGPKHKLAKWLELPPSERDFNSACRHIIKANCTTPSQRAAALMQLLEMKGDLNQTCVSKLPWLASPFGKLDATSEVDSSRQEKMRQQAARRFRDYSNSEAIENAPQLDLGSFLTRPPTKFAEGKEAADNLRKYFGTTKAKFPDLEKQANRFQKFLKKKKGLKVPKPGRRPSGMYSIAALFKYFPCSESLAAFREATKSLADDKDKQVVYDALAAARVNDQPLFDYFTNIALASTEATRAKWFEFDLAAFIEAIKAPRRYYEDTQQRERFANQLRLKIMDMEGRGPQNPATDDIEEEASPGFEGDYRIELLKDIVGQKLAWLAESEGDSSEYTIRKRTTRRFPEIKRRWRAEVDQMRDSEANLRKVLAELQSDHRDDFGSAPFFRELAKLENHPIWRDKGTKPWHADDPLKAWRKYKDLQSELYDKERPIHFTPAHPEHSPRFFIFPKTSEKNPKLTKKQKTKPGRLSRHDTGQLSFTAGIVLNGNTGGSPAVVRIHYSSPRLLRDQLRSDTEENLYQATWLQPMMEALGLSHSPEQVNFANCRITLQPLNPKNVQLTFPVEVSAEKVTEIVNKGRFWPEQFNKHPEGEGKFYNATLRWPHEKQPKNPPEPWHKLTERFNCIAVDLGQRHAGAFARLKFRDSGKANSKKVRFVGPVDNTDMSGANWYATVGRTGLFRLPGEDVGVWRERSSIDMSNPKDSGKPFDFRNEPWGSRGRPARNWETDYAADLMLRMEERSLLPENWRKDLSFPEQNDKLLVAFRRYQGRIARLHRWCWFLCGEEQKKSSALCEINECQDTRLVSDELKAQASKSDTRAFELLREDLRNRLQKAPILLENIANRILPLRGRSWHWEPHTRATEENPIYWLTRNGSSIDSENEPVWLRGQRGLSFNRIEQIEELRKRCQALNQVLRRNIGSKPPLRRDESIPDPCPDLLEKLKHIKEQRINQTAHIILAEALGLKLAVPPTNKRELRRRRDQHGIYNKIVGKDGHWIEPVDFIVIEDLTRYRTSQGRAPRENSRLMKWCHRAVRDKLKELSKVFGLSIIESPAAYSSRFCSRTGVPGFRAVEVTSGFSQRSHWGWLASKRTKDGKLTEQARRLLNLDTKLQQAQEELQQHWQEKKRNSPCPKRSLLIPWAGGPIFVPVKKIKVRTNEDGYEFCSAVVQADINAAINLGLRAVADPRLWGIHPRLRTKRVETVRAEQTVQLQTREKRKFGPNSLVLSIGSLSKESAVKETRNPNYFFDVAEIAQWDQAEVCDPVTDMRVSLSSGKALWGTVNKLQWKRCEEINHERLMAWEEKIDKIPM